MTIRVTKEYNLLDMTFDEALDAAFDTAREAERAATGHPLTYEKLANRCGKKQSTMHRYFTDPEYNPPTHILPLICRSLKNTVLIQWLCAHAGGVFVPVDATGSRSLLPKAVTDMNNEMAEAVAAMMQAMTDGSIDKAEARRVMKELRDVLEKAHAAVVAAESVMEERHG